jgi:hypothetical protein
MGQQIFLFSCLISIDLAGWLHIGKVARMGSFRLVCLDGEEVVVAGVGWFSFRKFSRSDILSDLVQVPFDHSKRTRWILAQ